MPPPPPVPSPPGIAYGDEESFDLRLRNAYQGGDVTVTFTSEGMPSSRAASVFVYDAAGNHVTVPDELSLCPCEPTAQGNSLKAMAANDRSLTNVFRQTPEPKSGSSLAEVLIAGQQALDVKGQESEANEKRLRLYVQAGLTLLLAAVCLYLLVHKKTPPTQRAAAIGVLGIALGYWFK